MSIIPYLTFSVTVPDRVSAVRNRLNMKVDSESWFPTLPYSGRIWDCGFKVVPVIWYRNSFLPIICGTFEGHADHTIVHITMRIHWGVLCFLCFWCAMFSQAFVPITQSVIAGEASWGVLLVPTFMILFALGLATGCFWWEAPQRREEITHALLGDGAAARGTSA